MNEHKFQFDLITNTQYLVAFDVSLQSPRNFSIQFNSNNASDKYSYYAVQ